MIRRLVSARTLALTAARRLATLRRAGYIGWAGQGNFGDDAMFRAADLLLGETPELLRSATVERLLEKVGLSGPTRFERVYLGGGTLINRDYLPIVEHCLDAKLRLVALGTGVGSAGFSMVEEGVDPRWPEALRRFDAVGVRGPLSQEKLARAGFAQAEVVGDLALALTPPAPTTRWTGQRFIVNCAPARGAADAELVERAEAALARLIRELAKAGWQPVPVAFDLADVSPLTGLMTRAGFSGVRPAVPRRFEDYRATAADATFSVGVRLHSAVLAAACGLVPVLIGYRDKCLDFAGSLEDERMVVPLDTIDADQLLDAAGEAIGGGQALGRVLHERCARLRDRLTGFVLGSATRG